MNHKTDTDTQVNFYEQEFYPLSNFSSFNLKWMDHTFPTLEHAYHWEKFGECAVGAAIRSAPSAHEAFKLAQEWKDHRRKDWDDVKVPLMRQLLWAKVEQHPYVKKKLLESGTRRLVEDSWRDDFWGWGPNKDGKNVLGRLWMEIRDCLNFKP
jgi:ribA/ribD-fused uncharacterized protein